MNAMRQQFKPEFLNRVDEFVIFNSLGKQQMRKITALELMKVSERLRDKRITLKATDEALDFLSEVCCTQPLH
jgi:ATP-dependent Clp protease ATP-binding subunit ClpB